MADPPVETARSAAPRPDLRDADGAPPPGAAAAEPWSEVDRRELDRARGGDAEALGRFFDRFVERIFALARRFSHDREEAQDLTQEIFLKVRRNLHRLDPARDPAPWLFTVAINVCRDHVRSAASRHGRRSLSIHAGDHGIELPDASADPERLYAEAEERRRLQAAILRLPADQLQSVLLHDFEGMPHERIAERVGIDHATARKRHSRAIRTLQRLLGEGGVA